MTFFVPRNAIYTAALTLAMASTNATAQTPSQARHDAWVQQQQYYQWYYQHYQPAQGGWRSALPAYRGYQTQQMQQPASWYAPPPAITPVPGAQPGLDRRAQSAARNRDTRQEAPPVVSAMKAEVAATPRPPKSTPAPKNSTAGWLTSFEDACAQAQKQGKPIVILFVHHGCAECDRMDQNLTQPGAMDTLACAIKTRLEFTDNPGIANRFDVTLTPTFLVLTPSGAEAYREVGALSVDRLRMIQPALESLVEPAS